MAQDRDLAQFFSTFSHYLSTFIHYLSTFIHYLSTFIHYLATFIHYLTTFIHYLSTEYIGISSNTSGPIDDTYAAKQTLKSYETTAQRLLPNKNLLTFLAAIPQL